MKCPKCKLVTFDHLQQCPRCETSFARSRRLTRSRPRDRRILIARPGADPSEPEETRASVPEPATETPAPTAESKPNRWRQPDEREPAPETGRRSHPRVVEAPAPPTTEQHTADAARMKERMIRASQVRRKRDQALTAEVDPVLPDWYEPEDDTDDTEVDDSVREPRALRR